mgnify:CR=1 FL=1
MSTAEDRVLSQMAEDILQMDPNREVTKVEEIGLQWAELDAAAGLLEETKKTLLAQLIQEKVQAAAAVGGNRPLPMNQAESLALADPRYEAHLRKMVDARKAANRAKVQYDSGRVKIELMRSLVAARREEMRLGGMRT